MVIRLDSEEKQEKILVPGRVLEAEKLMPQGHYRCRIAFVNTEKRVNEAIVRFIFAEERRAMRGK